MDYSENELLLRPRERKQLPFCSRIMQVALAMLIITVCVTLLVAPTVFVTIFVLESFHSNSNVPSNQQPPSILLRKLITQSKEDDTIQLLAPSQHHELITNVPDDQNSKTIHFTTKSDEDYDDVKPRSKRAVSNALDQLSTKDIHHLIQLLDSIQHDEKRLKNISEEDETRLNYLMDHFGIGHIRERRSVTSKNSVLGEETQDKDSNLKTSIATLYRLIYLLDSLQTG